MLAEGHCEWNWFPMSRQVYISNWYAQQNHLCLDLQGRTDWLWVNKLHNPFSLKLHVKIRGKLPKSSVELKQYGLFSSTTFDAKDSRGGGQSYQHHIPEQQRWGCPVSIAWRDDHPGWTAGLVGGQVCLFAISPCWALTVYCNTCFLISIVLYGLRLILVNIGDNFTNVVSTIFVSCLQFSVLTVGGTGGR